MILAAAVSAGAHPKVSNEGTYCNLESMNWFAEYRNLAHRSPKFWKQRKAELEELWRQGQAWALQELSELKQAERIKRHAAYEGFKSRRTPERLRLKWRETKRAQRAAAAAAHAEAEERRRRDEELAAQAAALAAEAERERQAREPIAGSGSEIELEIVRIPPNPRMVVCQHWAEGEERRCVVRVGRNANFRPGMKLLVKRPAVGADIEPWKYDGSLPRRPGHW
jgi:hypothetical protein